MGRPRKNFAGVGDSKPFTAPAGSFPAGEINWDSLTVNGQPIPEHLQGILPYEMTDQGNAAKNAGKEPARVQIVSDEFSKSLNRHEDAPVTMPWAKTDPIALTVEPYAEPGYRYGLLSDQISKTLGSPEARGWSPVVDPKTGQQPALGALKLHKMPEDMAKERDQFYRNMGDEAVREVTERAIEQQERLIRAAGDAGASPMRPGETVTGRSSVFAKDRAGFDDHSHVVGSNPSAAGSIGLQIQRGNSR